MNHGLFSMNYRLLWGVVAYYFGGLGSAGYNKDVFSLLPSDSLYHLRLLPYLRDIGLGYLISICVDHLQNAPPTFQVTYERTMLWGLHGSH